MLKRKLLIWSLKCSLVMIGVFYISSNSHCQVTSKNCATDHILSLNPDFVKKRTEIRQQAKEYISQGAKDLNGSTIVIPVVFQIVHNGEAIGTGSNLAKDQILAQLDQLNDDFRRTGTNKYDTPDFFSNLAADTEIEFCLSSQNSGGNDSGIVRTNINTLTGINNEDCWTTTYVDNNIVKPTAWDTKKFLNIYSVPRLDQFSGDCFRNTLLGYSHFPGLNPDKDVVVNVHFSIGSIDKPNPTRSQYLGHTVTHEVGHWLDLDHLWGTGVGGCSKDDGFDDTPQQDTDSGGLCPEGHVMTDNCTASAPGIQYMNYMDYTNDACMNMFSAEQAIYMKSIIQTARAELIDAPCTSAILAVSWLKNPQATVLNQNIKVDWQALTSTSHDFFRIEHSIDGQDFETIGQVFEKSDELDNTFFFEHASPKNGINYYNVVGVDNDGLEDQSNTTSVLFSKSSNFSIYPNPARNELTIQFVAQSFTKQNIQIINSIGQIVSNIWIEDPIMRINLSNLSKGVYFVKADGKYTKFVKS